MNRYSTCMARLVLVVLMMLSWQAAVATTKTVTYTLSRQQEGSTLYIYLTHSGDTPFAGTTTVGRQQILRNGQLYVLREGVIYDATGKMIISK